MGLVAVVLSFTRRVTQGVKHNDVKVDLGGGELVQAEHFAPSGDDSPPLPADYAYVAPSSRTGSAAALGYSDEVNEKTALPGEVRRYARNEDNEVVSQIHQRRDGSIAILNDGAAFNIAPDGSTTLEVGAGLFQMAASGDVTINGVTISTAGFVVAASVVAPVITGGGVTLSTHTHSSGQVPPPDSGS